MEITSKEQNQEKTIKEKANSFENFFLFLSGKKGIIGSILLTIVAYLALKGFIGEEEIFLMGGIVTTLTGVSSIYTKRIYEKYNK